MTSRRRHRAATRRALRDALAAFYDSGDPTADAVHRLLYAYARRMGANDLRTRQRIDAALARAADNAYTSAADATEPDYDADLDSVVATLRDGWLGRWDDALAAILAALATTTGSTAEARRLLRVVQTAIQAARRATATPALVQPPPVTLAALTPSVPRGPNPATCATSTVRTGEPLAA